MNVSGGQVAGRRSRNWWKIAFFVTLFAFELMREIAVISNTQQINISGSGDIVRVGTWTGAEGRWQRIDKGERLLPVAVRLDCDEQKGECTETTAKVLDGTLFPPDIETFPARFEHGSISYENSSPGCVSYSVRIDLALKKVFSVRQLKEHPSGDCGRFEKRIETQLAPGWEGQQDVTKGHFVPLLRLLGALLKTS